MIIAPFKVGDKWTIYKDPDDKRRYKLSVAEDLAEMQTTVVSVTAFVAGVSILVPAAVYGSDMIVMLGGLDVSSNPVNYCTFHMVCANTEEFDGTIWFLKKDR